MSELKNKLTKFSQELVTREINKLMATPKVLESLPLLVRPLIRQLIPKLPGYLELWINQLDEEEIEKKLVWIMEVVLPWMLSKSPTILISESEEKTPTVVSLEE